MPSTPPSQSNKYRFEADTPLDPPTLSGIMESIHDRIAAQEALVVDYQAAIDNLNNLGLQVIAENLAPQIEAAREQLDALQEQADGVEDQIAALLASGLAATGVSLTAIDGLTATNAQAAFAEIVDDITGLAEALGEIETDVAAAIAGISFTAIRPVITVTAAHTAVAGQRVQADSTGGAFNVTLPQDAAQGATVDVDPVGFGVSVVPNPAGAATTIEGHSSITIDQPNVGLTLTLRGTVWKIERRSIVNA
ncbi:hypothetical protein [Agrobacterium sp. MS2]|uniref:hypothetical protein n=1 Tax=Agrobacterium sp. MS2 TaxID=1345498 RepID=UPI000DB04C4A|nr:hypothetical protein [Agrobacterium sp. MS2]PZP72863.1 MAG: hypothetical protein DI604_13155 [Delftia acidovorans]RAL95611.1 hypothetical protein DOU54_20860 [Agrobacterium sp. MS2]